MFSENVTAQIALELANAEAARAAGNEGKARVCARRAAGAAVREYLRLSGQAVQGSAYDLLGHLQQQADVAPRVRLAVENLRLKVDEAYQLPGQIDLILEARTLVQALEQVG